MVLTEHALYTAVYLHWTPARGQGS